MSTILSNLAFIYVDRKDHRNGIKRPKKFRHESRRGVSSNLIPQFVYNCVFIYLKLLLLIY